MAEFTRKDIEGIVEAVIDRYAKYLKTDEHSFRAKADTIYAIMTELDAEVSECPTCGGSGGAGAPNQCISCLGTGYVEPEGWAEYTDPS